MNPDPSTEFLSLKIIAVRARVGVKKLGLLIARPEGANPFPVMWDDVRGYVAVEAQIAAWEETERTRRLPYHEAVKQGRIRARKAS